MKKFLRHALQSLTGSSGSRPEVRSSRQIQPRLEALEERVVAYAHLVGYWLLESSPPLPNGTAPAALDVVSENPATGTFTGKYFDNSRPGFPKSGVPVSGQLSYGPLYQVLGLDNMTFQGSLRPTPTGPTWNVSFQGVATDNSSLYPGVQTISGTLTGAEYATAATHQLPTFWTASDFFNGPS